MRAKVFWVPFYEEIKLRPCPFPPLKDDVFDEVILLTNEKKLLMGIDAANQVGLDWLLTILSTLDPEHRFFQKSFVPQKYPAKNIDQVDNNDGFFDDLP